MHASFRKQGPRIGMVVQNTHHQMFSLSGKLQISKMMGGRRAATISYCQGGRVVGASGASPDLGYHQMCCKRRSVMSPFHALEDWAHLGVRTEACNTRLGVAASRLLGRAAKLRSHSSRLGEATQARVVRRKGRRILLVRSSFSSSCGVACMSACPSHTKFRHEVQQLGCIVFRRCWKFSWLGSVLSNLKI